MYVAKSYDFLGVVRRNNCVLLRREVVLKIIALHKHRVIAV
jgi:hypothetical protein